MILGNIDTGNNVLLAPMAGVTDLPFRLLCAEMGCGMVFTEMVSGKGLFYGGGNTEALLESSPSERPVGVQLFGADPGVLSYAARVIAQIPGDPFDVIDLNMGCPAPKIFKNGEGAALMREPKRMGEIVKAVVSAVDKPVTVKIRKGLNDKSVNAVEAAKILEESGAAAITVHGRTREQYYSGEADWDIIAHVKRAVAIPVVGNGDVTTPQMAREMFERTGCDAVMIGRGAMGNPWIFRDTVYYLKTGLTHPAPSISERLSVALRHGKALIAQKGEFIGVREMRRHLAWYTKGLPNGARLREHINRAQTFEELKELLQSFYEL